MSFNTASGNTLHAILYSVFYDDLNEVSIPQAVIPCMQSRVPEAAESLGSK